MAYLQSVHLIAIAGGSGSGKTWLAKRLVAQFAPEAARVALDDFYWDLSHVPAEARGERNFDHPNSIDWPLFRQCLTAIRSGRPAVMPQYDFVSHTRAAAGVPWTPHRLVVLDGLWLLRRLEFRRLYSLSVFVDCPGALRLSRRCERDQRERGRSAESVRLQFESQVEPMHRRFVARQAGLAGVVVTPSTFEERVAELAERCRLLLAAGNQR
jgi:uridine kinase